MQMSLLRITLALASVLAVSGASRAQSQDDAAADKTQSSDSATKPGETSSKPKKVWTNENIHSTRGQISVVGAGASSAERGSAPHSSSSSGVVFVSPRDGAVVRPGERVHFEVSAPPGVLVGKMVLMGPIGVSEQILEAPPYSFIVSIPNEEAYINDGPLIGTHSLSAVGTPKPGRPDELATVTLDVEEPDMPVELVPGGNLRCVHCPYPTEMQFFWTGFDQSLVILGTFPGGRELVDVTRSTHLQLLSGNSAVVRISTEGTVTSIGPGDTAIVATYQLGGQQIRIFVPVTVTVPADGIIASPSSIDFGNRAVGTRSASQRVTLTNNVNGPITVSKLWLSGPFEETDNCTSSPLPAGGTCTVTIIFTPYEAGQNYGKIEIPNNYTQTSAIILSGKGI